MSHDEIAVMDEGKCILQVRGTRPFLSDKFDITAHKNYKYLADADKKNEFDVERYMKRRPAVVKPEEPFEPVEPHSLKAGMSGFEWLVTTFGHRRLQKSAQSAAPLSLPYRGRGDRVSGG